MRVDRWDLPQQVRDTSTEASVGSPDAVSSHTNELLREKRNLMEMANCGKDINANVELYKDAAFLAVVKPAVYWSAGTLPGGEGGKQFDSATGDVFWSFATLVRPLRSHLKSPRRPFVLVELEQRFVQRMCIVASREFPDRVHGEGRYAYIECPDTNFFGGDRPNGRTTGHVRTNGESLTSDLRPTTELAEVSCCFAVSGITLVGVDFDHGTIVDQRAMIAVVFGGIVRVDTVSVVCRDH